MGPSVRKSTYHLPLNVFNRDHLKYVLQIRKPVEQKSVCFHYFTVGNPPQSRQSG